MVNSNFYCSQNGHELHGLKELEEIIRSVLASHKSKRFAKENLKKNLIMFLFEQYLLNTKNVNIKEKESKW